MNYRLLTKFRELFEGQLYRHRASNQGDLVARRLYEDLHILGRSPRYLQRTGSELSVVNTMNTRHGIKARRGDGSFGEIVPGVDVTYDEGLVVGRGPIATIEIGIEVKILAKAMIKQIDRVVRFGKASDALQIQRRHTNNDWHSRHQLGGLLHVHRRQS